MEGNARQLACSSCPATVLAGIGLVDGVNKNFLSAVGKPDVGRAQATARLGSDLP
jgi:hypothetical protein